MAAARAWLVCAALALCACSANAHVHAALRLAAVAGAAPDATTTSKATGERLLQHQVLDYKPAAMFFVMSSLSWQRPADTQVDSVLLYLGRERAQA